MQEAKAKGMGGFDIWDVGTFVDDKKIVPAGPPFMGDKSLQSIGWIFWSILTPANRNKFKGLTHVISTAICRHSGGC
ncbi:MAG: hypothetical protein WKF89_20485 [Chitinophagaceae bacterium]